jgi:hypothetical protein
MAMSEYRPYMTSIKTPEQIFEMDGKVLITLQNDMIILRDGSGTGSCTECGHGRFKTEITSHIIKATCLACGTVEYVPREATYTGSGGIA